MDIAAELTARLSGCHLTSVQKREFDWVFVFATKANLTVECPWRILVNNHIAFTGSDHGHQFGLPEPLDGEEKSQDLLSAKSVQQISIRPDTGDLAVHFTDQTVLEVINMSAGYEGWNIGAGGLLVVAASGGKLTIFGAEA